MPTNDKVTSKEKKMAEKKTAKKASKPEKSEKTFTDAWNEKYADFVGSEKGVNRVMEHRKIDNDTEIYCLGMDDKTYQVRIYNKGKAKIHGKFEKSTEALTSYRELRDEMKPVKAEKPKPAAKKPAAKKAAAKKTTKKPAKKEAIADDDEDDFFD